MRHPPALLMILWLAGWPLTTAACGVCIEDKVAATYDDAIISKAANGEHAVAFFEIVGILPNGTQDQQSMLKSVERVRGVEPGTVRLSNDPAALSFAVDIRAVRLTDAVQEANQALTPRHLRLRTISRSKSPNIPSCAMWTKQLRLCAHLKDWV